MSLCLNSSLSDSYLLGCYVVLLGEQVPDILKVPSRVSVKDLGFIGMDVEGGEPVKVVVIYTW